MKDKKLFITFGSAVIISSVLLVTSVNEVDAKIKTPRFTQMTTKEIQERIDKCWDFYNKTSKSDMAEQMLLEIRVLQEQIQYAK